MANESRPSDRLILLEAKHVRVSERIKRLEEAIGELQSAPILRADAAARLVKYRQHHERLQYERATLEWEIEASHGALEPMSACGRCPTRCSSGRGKRRRRAGCDRERGPAPEPVARAVTALIRN